MLDISGDQVFFIRRYNITIYSRNAPAGRPASPNPSVYALADALAQRRGVTLREMLETLRSRWLTLRGRIATIITELDRVEDELSAAGSVGEITEILGRLGDWG